MIEKAESELLYYILNSKNIEQFSMLIHDVEGNPMLPYYNADTVEELLEEVCEY